jgi:hypothetical protein
MYSFKPFPVLYLVYTEVYTPLARGALDTWGKLRITIPLRRAAEGTLLSEAHLPTLWKEPPNLPRVLIQLNSYYLLTLLTQRRCQERKNKKVHTVLCPRRIDALTITCDANAYIP